MSGDTITPGAMLLDGGDDAPAADAPLPTTDNSTASDNSPTPEPVAAAPEPAAPAPVEADEPALPDPRDDQERGLHGEVTRLRGKIRTMKQAQEAVALVDSRIRDLSADEQRAVASWLKGESRLPLALQRELSQPAAPVAPPAPVVPDGPSDEELLEIAQELVLVDEKGQYSLDKARKAHARQMRHTRAAIDAALAPLHHERTTEKAQRLSTQAYSVGQQLGIEPAYVQQFISSLPAEMQANDQAIAYQIIAAAGAQWLRTRGQAPPVPAAPAPVAPAAPVAPPPRPQFTETPGRSPVPPINISRAEQAAISHVGMSKKDYVASQQRISARRTPGGNFVLDDD